VPTQVRDLRLLDALDPAKHFTEQKNISVARAGVPFVINDLTTSKHEVYDSLGKVYMLYATLSNDATLREFAFILNWPKMKPEEKREMYSKYACHELHFFLAQKDKAFFDTVVQPYLRHKKDKTFLDEYLIGADLREYLKPWRFARLNVVERILLSRRIAGEQPLTTRHVKDLYDLIPPDIERDNYLFKTALKGSALETGEGEVPVVEALRKSLDMPMTTAEAAARPAEAPSAAPPGPGRAQLARRRLEEAEKKAEAVDALKADAEDEGRPGYFERDRAVRAKAAPYYRKLEKTEEWVENNYWHLPIEEQDGGLVAVNAFWNDYAQHDGQTPFQSTHVARVARNFTEMMFALSVLDLPFEAAEH